MKGDSGRERGGVRVPLFPKRSTGVSARPDLSDRRLRVLVLWQGKSGYFDASLRALSATGVDIRLAYAGSNGSAPFDDEIFSWLVPEAYCWHGAPDSAAVLRLVREFEPDAVLVSSWHISGYRKALRALKPGTLRVLCMDNQWRERPKQWLGRLTARFYLQTVFDAVFVPGDRQARFAQLLGFRGQRIWRGLYCADTTAFSGVVQREPVRAARFLFVGRLVEEKGIRELAAGYDLYRESAADPWPLMVAGTGPLADEVERVEGIEMRGFVQPRDLPDVMAGATTLVLPSLFEPWGVVVHEAAAAGLSIACSDAVGAAVHLAQDGYNGYIFPAGSVQGIADALSRISRLSPDETQRMSEGSRSLAAQITVERWGTYVKSCIIDSLNGV